MAIQKTKLLDPVELDQNVKYDERGITRLSNDDSVVERDDAGNVILRENQNNQLLTIETIYKKILNSSVIKVLDTQFNYFKFPVRVVENPLDLNLDVDLDFEQDNISANLTIPIPLDSKNQPQEYQRINSTDLNTWYYNGEEINGGFKLLQFTGGTAQPTPNSYTITEDILNTLREQNKTLRFKIKTQYRTGNTNRTEFRMRLNRSNSKIFHEFKTIELLTEQNVSGGPDGTNNPHNFTVKTTGDYPVLSMTYIVDMDDTKPGDVYNFSVVSSNNGFILAHNSYWDIDIVDIPTEPGIYGASDKNISGNAGVYRFSGNTLLRDSSLNTKAKRSKPNQEVELFT